MNLDNSRDQGQVTLLVIAISVGLLSLLPVFGGIAKGLILHQKLANLADSAALSGGQEIEFNAANACAVASAMISNSQQTTFYCKQFDQEIHVSLTQTNPVALVRFIWPTITAESKAGLIAP